MKRERERGGERESVPLSSFRIFWFVFDDDDVIDIESPSQQ